MIGPDHPLLRRLRGQELDGEGLARLVDQLPVLARFPARLRQQPRRVAQIAAVAARAVGLGRGVGRAEDLFGDLAAERLQHLQLKPFGRRHRLQVLHVP
jgi:hypothetical protein